MLDSGKEAKSIFDSQVKEWIDERSVSLNYDASFAIWGIIGTQVRMIVSMNKLGFPASGGGMAGVLFHDIMEWMITHDMPSLAVIDDETNDTIQVSEKTLNKAKEILEKQNFE